MTVLNLLKFNGADASTVFTDEVGVDTWAIAGNGTIGELDDTTVQEGSAALKVDAGNYLESTFVSPITGAFTMEGWFYIDPLSAPESALFQIFLTTPYVWQMRFNVSSNVFTLYSPYYGSLTVGDMDSVNPDWVEGNWVHVAVSRTVDNLWTAQVGGLVAQNGFVGPSGLVFTSDVVGVRIGGAASFTTGMTGWCDGFRISDEVLYPSGQAGLTPVDLGLSYTIAEIGYKILDHAPVPTLSQQYITPFSGLATSRIVVNDSPPGEGAAPASVQYWG